MATRIKKGGKSEILINKGKATGISQTIINQYIL